MDYNRLLQVKKVYDSTERATIAHSIRLQLKHHKIRVYAMEGIIGISKHTAYAYTKETGYTVKPDIYNLLLLAAYLNIDVMDFFTITGLEE